MRTGEKGICALAVLFTLLGVGFQTYPSVRFTGLLCFLLALASLAWLMLGRREDSSKAARICKRALLVGFIAGTLCFCALETVIIRYGTEDPSRQVDVVIVLGAGLNGETPSLALQSRIDRAARYLKTHEDLQAVLSGGQGSNEKISEAEAMRRSLVKQGIEEERLLLEDQSRNTMQNMRNSMALLRENGYDLSQRPVGIVTNEFHLFRSKLLATVADDVIPVGIAAPFPMWIGVHYYIREAFALVKTLVLYYRTG